MHVCQILTSSALPHALTPEAIDIISILNAAALLFAAIGLLLHILPLRVYRLPSAANVGVLMSVFDGVAVTGVFPEVIYISYNKLNSKKSEKF